MSPNEQNRFEQLKILGDMIQDTGHPLGKYLSAGRFRVRRDTEDWDDSLGWRRAKGDEHFHGYEIQPLRKEGKVLIRAYPKDPEGFVQYGPKAVEIELDPKEWLQSRVKPTATRYGTWSLASRGAWDGLSRYLSKRKHPLAEIVRPENHELDTTDREWDDELMERKPDLEKHGIERVGVFGDDIHFRIRGTDRVAPEAAAKLKLAKPADVEPRWSPRPYESSFEHNGVPYRVVFLTTPTGTEFVFNDADTGKTGITGAQGPAARGVFAKVAGHFIHGLKKFGFPRVDFTASEPSRMKLYETLGKHIPKYLPDYEFVVDSPGDYRVVQKKLKLASSVIMKVPLPQLVPDAPQSRSYILP